MSAILTKDMDLIEQAGVQEKFMGLGKNQANIRTSDFGGTGGQLDEKLCQVLRPPDLASGISKGGILEPVNSTREERQVSPGLEFGNDGSSDSGETATAKGGPSADELRKPGGEDTGGSNGQPKVQGWKVGIISNNGEDGSTQVLGKALGERVAEGGLAGMTTGTDEDWMVRSELRERTGNQGIDRNMGRINGRIEVIPEGIAASTLGTESELKEESNPVPRGPRVVRLDVKDNGCPGISPDVRLGAGTGGNSLEVFRMEVNPESYFTTTGCGEVARKAGAHNDEHHTVKEGVMDSEVGGGEGHLHTEEGGSRRPFIGLSHHDKDGSSKEGVEIDIEIDKNNEDRTSSGESSEIERNVEDNGKGRRPEASDINLAPYKSEGRSVEGSDDDHVLTGPTARLSGEWAMGSRCPTSLHWGVGVKFVTRDIDEIRSGVGTVANWSFSREVELGGSPQLEERSIGMDLRTESKLGTKLQAGVRTPMQALDAAGSSLQPNTDSLQVHERRSESGSSDGRAGTENIKGNGMGNREFRDRNDQSRGSEFVFQTPKNTLLSASSLH